MVFGWGYASHVVGAGVAALYAGWVRESLGDYLIAWLTAGSLCLIAAGLCANIPRVPVLPAPEPQEPLAEYF